MPDTPIISMIECAGAGKNHGMPRPCRHIPEQGCGREARGTGAAGMPANWRRCWKSLPPSLCRRWVTGLFLIAACGLRAAWAADLHSELDRLSHKYGFSIEGLEQLGSEQVTEPGSEELAGRLRDLLQNYNHLVVTGEGRRIEKLIILGAKGARPKPSTAPVGITRDGAHHRVDALLTGRDGRIVPVSLIIDTGASNIVLPESMIADLGFRPEQLQASLSRTASGTLPVKLGVLKSVAVGPHEMSDVGVSFVEDRKLGGLFLLGMSFLGRFRFTIDDEKSELILLAR